MDITAFLPQYVNKTTEKQEKGPDLLFNCRHHLRRGLEPPVPGGQPPLLPRAHHLCQLHPHPQRGADIQTQRVILQQESGGRDSLHDESSVH